jgi:nucleoside triphosphate diphosphatase
VDHGDDKRRRGGKARQIGRESTEAIERREEPPPPPATCPGERPLRKTGPSVLDPVPGDLSSLGLAALLTKRASRVGFDWPTVDGVLDKLDEENGEIKEAISSGDRARIRDEIGDLLFVVVNLARFLRIDPDRALRGTIRKFVRRFRYIETGLARQGKPFSRSSLEEMDGLWNEAKRKQSVVSRKS